MKGHKNLQIRDLIIEHKNRKNHLFLLTIEYTRIYNNASFVTLTIESSPICSVFVLLQWLIIAMYEYRLLIFLKDQKKLKNVQ